MASWRLTVDGHDWLVHDRATQPGAYDVEWLTGPEGYGFSMASSDGTPTDEEGLTAAIANFLTQVDPETGHID